MVHSSAAGGVDYDGVKTARRRLQWPWIVRPARAASAAKSRVPSVVCQTKQKQKQDDRVAFFCTAHPDRLLCDNPGDFVGPGGMVNDLEREHADEVPAMCFVCKQPIKELLATPVFAKIELHRPLTGYSAGRTPSTTWGRCGRC